MLLIPTLCLGYQNIPKVATTSMFNWLYQAHGQVRETDPINPNYERQFFLRQYKSDSLKDIQRAKGTYLRVALTRDPVRRFLSVYGNRVVAKRSLDVGANSAQTVLDAGLPLNPQLNEFIELLDGYLAASRTISHHAQSQLQLLGPDLSVYDHLLDISEIDHLIDLIRQHWRAQGMDQALSNADEKMQRLQTGGPKIGLAGISRRSFERLLEYYQPDYAAIPTLDQSSIKAQFIEENGGSNLFLFDFSKFKKSEVSAVRQNKKVSDRPDLGDLPTVKVRRHPLKAAVRLCLKFFRLQKMRF